MKKIILVLLGIMLLSCDTNIQEAALIVHNNTSDPIRSVILNRESLTYGPYDYEFNEIIAPNQYTIFYIDIKNNADNYHGLIYIKSQDHLENVFDRLTAANISIQRGKTTTAYLVVNSYVNNNQILGISVQGPQ